MFLDGLRSTLEVIPPWVLLAFAFLAGAIEATPVIGLIVPANSLVFLLGLQWATVHRGPADLVVAYAVGSFLGDLAFYGAGARFGLEFMERWPGFLRLDPERRHALERLFSAHGMKTVLLARFQPITRSFAPYVAGAARLSLPRFTVAAAVASTAAAILVVASGYLTGLGLEAVGRALGTTIVVAVVAIIALAILHYWITRKLRVVARTTLSLVFVAAIAGGTLAALAIDTLRHGSLSLREQTHWPRVLAQLHGFDLPAFVLATLGDARLLALAGLAVAAWLAWRGRRREMILLLVAGPALLAAATLLELLIPRAPPRASTAFLSLPGFPEVGAALAVSLAVLGLWLARKPGLHPWKNRLVIAAALLGAGLLAAAPLFLGRAWPTETAGGIALGAFWTSATLLGDLYVYSRRHAAPWADLATR